MKLKKYLALLLTGLFAFGNISAINADENETPIPVLYDTQNVTTVTTSTDLSSNFKSQIDYTKLELVFGNLTINSDVPAQVIQGKFMLPLRATLEALGYGVTWNPTSQSIDLAKGAQFTTVTIGKNSYFKNKMAPWELSCAPVIVGSRTLVPAEFITEILGVGMSIEKNILTLYDEAFVTKTGYIYEVKKVGEGLDLIVTTEKQTVDTFAADNTDYIIIHVLPEASIVNRNTLDVGDPISVVISPIMTMIFPPQTTGIIIY